MRCAENRMIKRIPRLDPELEVHLLTYWELLPNGQIGREVPRCPDAAHGSWSITQGERVRNLEHVGIHKVVVHPIRTVITLGCSHNIRSLCAVCRQWLSAIAKEEAQRTSLSSVLSAFCAAFCFANSREGYFFLSPILVSFSADSYDGVGFERTTSQTSPEKRN